MSLWWFVIHHKNKDSQGAMNSTITWDHLGASLHSSIYRPANRNRAPRFNCPGRSRCVIVNLLQAVSIIRVTDEKRKLLAEYAGSPSLMWKCCWVFGILWKLSRHAQINPEVKTDDFTELTLIGAVDSGIMAQNCMLAAGRWIRWRVHWWLA